MWPVSAEEKTLGVLDKIVRALKERGAASPESKAPAAKPERDIRRITAADFSGSSWGDVAGLGSAPGSADDLLYRHARQKH